MSSKTGAESESLLWKVSGTILTIFLGFFPLFIITRCSSLEELLVGFGLYEVGRELDGGNQGGRSFILLWN